MHGQRTAQQAALEKTEKEIGNVTAELHQLDENTEAMVRKIQALNNDRISSDFICTVGQL